MRKDRRCWEINKTFCLTFLSVCTRGAGVQRVHSQCVHPARTMCVLCAHFAATARMHRTSAPQLHRVANHSSSRPKSLILKERSGCLNCEPTQNDSIPDEGNPGWDPQVEYLNQLPRSAWLVEVFASLERQ